MTIIELMLVMAIIGILSAVLYPVVSNYLRNSRDAQRISAIGSLSLTMEVFYRDQNRYPPSTPDGCIRNPDTNTDSTTPRNSIITPKYILSLPKSPREGYDEGCGPNGQYAYGVSEDHFAYILLSTME